MQQVARPVDVGVDGTSSGLGVTGAQGLQNIIMEAGAAATASVEAVGRAAQVRTDLHPQPLDDRRQQSGAGEGVERKVEFLVQGEAGVFVIALVGVGGGGEDPGQPLDVGGTDAGGGEFDSEALDGLTGAAQVFYRVEREGWELGRCG